MQVIVFEAEEWERKACLALQQQHSVMCTKEPLGETTVSDYDDAEIVSPFEGYQ